MNIEAKLVDDISEHFNEPGSFSYYTIYGSAEIAGLNFVCPCGCNAVLGVNFKTWQWNGNKEKPTITPSILHMNDCKYHGFLTNSIFTSC